MKRQAVRPVRWAEALKKLFRPAAKKRVATRLGMEELTERIVPTVYKPVATVADGAPTSLRADIIAANNDVTANATETFDLTSGATYTLTIANPGVGSGPGSSTGSEDLSKSGDLNLNNLHGKGVKTYIFVGLGIGATIDQTVLDRVFDIVGPNVNAQFKNVTITGGRAINNGAVGALLGATNSEGGGILNQGGTVTLTDVRLENNSALGVFFGNGGNGRSASPGFSTAPGSAAYGGGLYSTAGTITITSNTIISGNDAVGGTGGGGGNGGNVSGSATGQAGTGGTGLTGGNAGGGGVYLASGNLMISGDVEINTNVAKAGTGGHGGAGGNANVKNGIGGLGAFGGSGGNVVGGGIAVLAGNVTINSTCTVENNEISAGAGGAGGAGGNATKTGGVAGAGAIGGKGGSAEGAGIYCGTGAVVVEGDTVVSQNRGAANLGGVGGNGGNGYVSAGSGGSGGLGGSGGGGGIFSLNGSVIIETDSAVTANQIRAAIGGTGGAGGAGVGPGAVVPDGANAGNAGTSFGGGVYAGAGNVAVETTSSVNSNTALGRGHHTGTSAGGSLSGSLFTGGAGGAGGKASFKGGVAAGVGGLGGSGCSAVGGGIYAADGSVSVMTKSSVTHNAVFGFKGGTGGAGGAGTKTGDIAGAAGSGGVGGTAEGGGIYVGTGTVTLSKATVDFNHGIAGDGGNGGKGGAASGADQGFGGSGGAGGSGGDAGGGGVFVFTGGVLVENASQVNSNGLGATTSGRTGIIGGNGGIGGAGGNARVGGEHGFGGAGGNAGSALGGGILANAGTVSVLTGTTVDFNVLQGGVGGEGGSGAGGGNAGSGGDAAGGGIYAPTGSVLVSGAVVSNFALAGAGGLGGIDPFVSAGEPGGNGGAAGGAFGGGIYAGTGSVTLVHHAKLNDNQVVGAEGGSGGQADTVSNGGAGGQGGNAEGGGLYDDAGNVTATSAVVSKNVASGLSGGIGGVGITGGVGGNAGVAQGGGIFVNGGSLTLTKVSVNANTAGGVLGGGAGGGVYRSSISGIGGTGGPGGTGGDAAGGGIYMASGSVTLTLIQSSVTNNSAGPGGDGGTGGGNLGAAGNSGNTFGGGIYTAAGITNITNSTIGLNVAQAGGDLATSTVSVPGVSEGGGIYFASAMSGTLNNSTVAENTSDNEGGGIYNAGVGTSTLTLTSTLVAENTSNTVDAGGNLDSDLYDANAADPTTIVDSLVQNPNGNSVTKTPGNFSGETNTGTANAVNLSTKLSTATNGTMYFTFTGTSDATGNGSNPNNLQYDQLGDPRSTITGTGTKTDIGAVQSTSTAAFVPFILSSGANGYVEVVSTSTHATLQNFQPFPGYTGVVSVALGDVNGDGVPDIVVAGDGMVKVYSGAAALKPGVIFSVSSTWSSLPGGTPVLKQFTPFAGYTGPLNVAVGNVLGGTTNYIIVGSGTGTTTTTGRSGTTTSATSTTDKVAVFNPTTGTQVGNTLAPFGGSGGVVVAAGSVLNNGTAQIVVGTENAGDSVAVYTFTGTGFVQDGKTISAFGATTSTTAHLDVAVLNTGTTGDEIAISFLLNGTGKVDIVNASGTVLKTITAGSSLTALAISAYNTANVGADSLLIGTVPTGSAQFHIVNPSTGLQTGSFSELTPLTGGIALAGL